MESVGLRTPPNVPLGRLPNRPFLLLPKRVPGFHEAWARVELFESHQGLLVHSLDRFSGDNYISCCAAAGPVRNARG